MTCPKCKGTGKLPFEKDGKTIPHALVYCDCHQEEGKYNTESTWEMIDGDADYYNYPEYYWWRLENTPADEQVEEYYTEPGGNVYRCPRCLSVDISIDYPNIFCLSCHYSETLIDFPISYDVHRSLCQYHGWHDPGSCELPPQPQPIQIIERVRVLRPEDQAAINHLEKRLNEHLDKSKKQIPNQKEYKGIE